MHDEKNDLILKPACDPQIWMLDPEVTFLNHGSFGSCPRAVLHHQLRNEGVVEDSDCRVGGRCREGRFDLGPGAIAASVEHARVAVRSLSPKGDLPTQ